MAPENDGRRLPDIPPGFPLRGLLTESPFGVLIIDSDSTVRYTNEALTETLGYAPSELVGDSLAQLIPDRWQSSHFEAFEAYLESGQRHLDWDHIELSAVHREGHEIPVVIALRETPTEDERLFTGVFTDISERSRLEAELESSVDVLHELYVIASDSTLSFDQRRKGVLELGREYLDLPYAFVTEIAPSEQRIIAAVGSHELLQPGSTCPIEESYCRRTVEGEGFLAVANAVDEGWKEDSAYERFDLGSYIGGKLVVDGDLFGTLCFASNEPRGRPFTDTERTFVELASRWLGYEFQRQRQRQRLERQNARLDRFASRASHDLRNPLSVAKGRLELARERYPDDEDIEATVEALTDADARIDEMLEFARLGETVTDPQQIPLTDVARSAWETVGDGVATMVVEDDIELSGDPDRIERLLENLFRNSVEHGLDSDDSVEYGPTNTDSQAGEHVEPSGSDLTIRLGMLSGESGFYIEDDGLGIPEKDRDTVLESGYTTSDDGSGFGLAIVTEVATAHEWDVQVSGADGGGARFEFVGAAVR